MAGSAHVGVLGEKPLHAALKRWYASPGDRIEHPVEGFVVDIAGPEELIEIQTRGFSAMRRKLPTLLDGHRVRLVYPIATEKWIVKVDEDGHVVSRRRSPKRGLPVDLFAELTSFPELVAHPGFVLDIPLVQVEELWRFDGRRGRRRRGWVVDERRLIDVVDRCVVDTPASLAALLPRDLPVEFTTADLARSIGRPRRLAQQMAYCLRRIGAIDVIAKRGNTLVYRIGA